jgi:hypothetical protein
VSDLVGKKRRVGQAGKNMQKGWLRGILEIREIRAGRKERQKE